MASDSLQTFTNQLQTETGSAIFEISKLKLETDTSEVEWQNLFHWWREFRAQKRVTIARLFELCGETVNPSLYPYIGLRGSSKKVSKKAGSLSQRAISLLQKAKSLDENATTFAPLSLADVVADLAEDARSILSEKGIVNVDFVAKTGAQRIEVDMLDHAIRNGSLPANTAALLSLFNELAIERDVITANTSITINYTRFL